MRPPSAATGTFSATCVVYREDFVMANGCPMVVHVHVPWVLGMLFHKERAKSIPVSMEKILGSS